MPTRSPTRPRSSSPHRRRRFGTPRPIRAGAARRALSALPRCAARGYGEQTVSRMSNPARCARSASIQAPADLHIRDPARFVRVKGCSATPGGIAPLSIGPRRALPCGRISRAPGAAQRALRQARTKPTSSERRRATQVGVRAQLSLASAQVAYRPGSTPGGSPGKLALRHFAATPQTTASGPNRNRPVWSGPPVAGTPASAGHPRPITRPGLDGSNAPTPNTANHASPSAFDTAATVWSAGSVVPARVSSIVQFGTHVYPSSNEND